MRALQIELIKINKPANYVLLGLIVLIAAGTAAISFHSLGKVHMPNGRLLLNQLWNLQSSIVDIILAIFIIMNIGKEYSDNTLRRSIIDGYTRDQFFRNKLLVLVLSVVLVYIVVKIVLFCGGFISGQADAVKDYLTMQVIINTFVRLLSVGIMAFFLVFLTRSIAIGIVIYFAWGIVENILAGLEKFVAGWDFDLGNYLPMSSMDRALTSNDAVQPQTIIIAVAYLLIMLLVPYVLLLKRDIK